MQPIDSMRERLGLGGVAAGQTFDSFQPRPGLPQAERRSLDRALEVARSFMDNPRTVVFHGPNGIGKTHLACAIGNALLERYGSARTPVCLLVFEEGLRQLRQTYEHGHDGMAESWYLERWRSIPVLILDEVGQEGREEPSEFTRRIGYDIINGRYRAGNKPIVMTTNKTPAELSAWITASAVDRLMEMGEFVRMEGTSWRIKGRR